jgi:putative transposase
MDQFTRRLVGFGVHGGTVTADDVCRMFNVAIQRQGVPRHLSTDQDPAVRGAPLDGEPASSEIDETKTVPHGPAVRRVSLELRPEHRQGLIAGQY